eukprot:2183200-Rhodomonas_salina.2
MFGNDEGMLHKAEFMTLFDWYSSTHFRAISRLFVLNLAYASVCPLVQVYPESGVQLCGLVQVYLVLREIGRNLCSFGVFLALIVGNAATRWSSVDSAITAETKSGDSQNHSANYMALPVS